MMSPLPAKCQPEIQLELQGFFQRNLEKIQWENKFLMLTKNKCFQQINVICKLIVDE